MEQNKKIFSKLNFKYLGILLILLSFVITVFSITNGDSTKSIVDYNSSEDSNSSLIDINKFQNINTNQTIPEEYDFKLIINKLDLNVPVIENVSGVKKDEYMEVLTRGVAHQINTSTPERQGNTVIFGHSSVIPGSKESIYSEVFARLNELGIGDEIKITYKKNEYLYKVSEKKIVLPTEVDILKDTNFPQLTIYTCWPLKTDQKRLVVIAKQI